MGIQLKNRTFLKMFAIFFLCLLLVAYLLFAYFFTREQEAVRAKNQGEIESSIEHAVDYLEELVQREGRLSAQLRAYPWVVQMASGSEVFAGRFTPRRLQEISQDFLFNTLLNTEVLYRAVYFTKNNRVMHGGGMNGGEYFFKSQGVPEEQLEGFMQMITGTVKARRVLYGSGGGVCFRGNVLLINPVQNSSRPGAYLCTMLNTSVVAEQIKLMLPAGLTGFRVYDGENQALVLEDRPGDGGDRVLGGYTIPELGWELEFYMDAGSGPVLNDSYFWALLLMLIMAVLVSPVAFFLAAYLYQQLERLFSKLPGERASKDIYFDIGNNISRMVQALEVSKRDTELRRILAGTLQPDGARSGLLPNYQRQWVQVVLLDSGSGDSPGAIEGLLREMKGLHCEFVPDYGGMLVLIVSSAQEREISAFCSRFAEKFGPGPGEIFPGPVCQGCGGITASYQEALKKKQYRGFSGIPAYYLPIEAEHHLILALRGGKAREAANILDQLLEENAQQLKCGKLRESDLFQLSMVLINDLVRIVLEKNLSRELLASLETMEYSSVYDVFGKLSAVAAEVCAMLSAREEGVSAAAREIVEYIDSNYVDSGLSINVLQDVFHMSANTINKHIRDAVGTTFLPYLTYVRMEKAKELLSVGDVKISEVYKQVGYDLEFSFRRAFIRYSGYKPQNHIAPEENFPRG